MKYYQEHIAEFNTLLKEDENYIILNDGKPIQEHIVNEGDIEVSLDELFDTSKYANVKKNGEIDKIIEDANFNVHLAIHADLTLKLIHLNDDEDNITYSIEIDSKKNVKIIDIYSRVSKPCKVVTEVMVNSRSTLDYFAFSRCESEVVSYFNAFVDERATLNITNLMANENKYKLISNVYMIEKFSKVYSRNAIVNNSNEDQEYNYNVSHLVSHTESKMMNNAICNSSSFIVLNTDGIIKKDAIETDLNQKSKGILLDPKSNIIANPILEIDEYDCKASHGAGVGAIDESDLFYLMSRGIERNDAIRLIINSYIEPVLKAISDLDVMEYISKIVNEKI